MSWSFSYSGPICDFFVSNKFPVSFSLYTDTVWIGGRFLEYNCFRSCWNWGILFWGLYEGSRKCLFMYFRATFQNILVAVFDTWWESSITSHSLAKSCIMSGLNSVVSSSSAEEYSSVSVSSTDGEDGGRIGFICGIVLNDSGYAVELLSLIHISSPRD